MRAAEYMPLPHSPTSPPVLAEWLIAKIATVERFVHRNLVVLYRKKGGLYEQNR
jgi:hypothetical protein